MFHGGEIYGAERFRATIALRAVLTVRENAEKVLLVNQEAVLAP